MFWIKKWTGFTRNAWKHKHIEIVFIRFVRFFRRSIVPCHFIACNRKKRVRIKTLKRSKYADRRMQSTEELAVEWNHCVATAFHLFCSPLLRNQCDFHIYPFGIAWIWSNNNNNNGSIISFGWEMLPLIT